MAHHMDGGHQHRRGLTDAAYGQTVSRLLPWTTDDGRPCYLLTDNSHLATVADQIESVQLGMSRDVLGHARKMLSADRAGSDLSVVELRWLAHRLTECLHDALRVAESRGARPPDAADCHPHLGSDTTSL